MLCSSKDVLMRVVAQNISPELTLVEKVFHHIYIFSYSHHLSFVLVACTLNVLVITFSGDDCQPRLCICATLDTTILDALHIMHDGKFLHIPVIDRGVT